MANIELVIKIPEEEYKWIIKSNETVFANVVSKECMLHVIKNGISLPKGHGKLIDVDTLESQIVTVPYGYNWECGETTYAEEEIIRVDDIWNAPPIIKQIKQKVRYKE